MVLYGRNHYLPFTGGRKPRQSDQHNSTGYAPPTKNNLDKVLMLPDNHRAIKLLQEMGFIFESDGTQRATLDLR